MNINNRDLTSDTPVRMKERHLLNKLRSLVRFGLMALILSTFAVQMKQTSLLTSSKNHATAGTLRNAKGNTNNEVQEEPDNNISTFNKMHNKLHKTAAALKHIEKKKYEIGVSMERGTGGLVDTDRALLAEIYSSVNSVFGFGLGESTKIAAWVGVPRYVGVDSDADWVTNVREEIKMDHFRFIFADIGSTGLYGNPNDETLQKIPLSYQTAPLNDEMEAFDFYLIDGRYRVACACASMLHAMSRGGNVNEVMFGVHDYPDRQHYHQLESVADIVKQSERLRVFRLKPSTTEYDIEQLWVKNTWDKGR